jgi:hypothetical protein
MEILIPLGILFSVWIVVIWGSNYFNQNLK